MVSRAGDKFKLSGDAATLMLKVRRLNAEVLSSGTVAGEPAKQPGVAPVSSWDFQCDHVMAPECHQAQLGALPGQGQGLTSLCLNGEMFSTSEDTYFKQENVIQSASQVP